ncbi:MAG: lipoate--protein ligase family protein, partial [Candidatus Omnitrophota bacterium]
MMRFVEYSCKSPEETIALDELLLKKAEAGDTGETLRIWSATDHFAVLGRAGGAGEDCYTEKCRRDGVKIVRRSSGGGTVLQGPGCFNFSVILSYERDSSYRDINASYRAILQKMVDALAAEGFSAEFRPVSDLASGGKKFSGNAQARKRGYFLHHGTILFDFDIDMVSQYLKHPIKEPAYRGRRPHGEFLTNIPFTYDELTRITKKVFLPEDHSVWDPAEKDINELNRLV